MSAGVFVRSRYAASYGDADQIHPIRVQPETIEADAGGTDNAPPPGAVTNPISAKVTASKRSLGLRPRLVTLQLTGTPPAEYKAGSIVRIPCLTTAFYDVVTPPGTEVTYLDTTWETVSVSNEEAR